MECGKDRTQEAAAALEREGRLAAGESRVQRRDPVMDRPRVVLDRGMIRRAGKGAVGLRPRRCSTAEEACCKRHCGAEAHTRHRWYCSAWRSSRGARRVFGLQHGSVIL